MCIDDKSVPIEFSRANSQILTKANQIIEFKVLELVDIEFF